MIWVTDAITGTKVAINKSYIVAVFTTTEGEHPDKTAINLTTGQIICEEADFDIVAQMTAA